MRKLNVEENEEKKDLIKLLLEKDMTHICFNILSRMDSKSFTSCRLVSHKWKDFIDYQFYKTPKGKQWIRNKLTSNYFNENFTPREEKISLQNPIIDFIADEFSICVITEHFLKDGHSYLDIHSFDFHSLKKNWSFNSANETTEDSFEPLKNYNNYVNSEDFQSFNYVLALNKKRLYLYNRRSVANIYIINSENGMLLQKLDDVFSKGQRTICGVVDFENSILATYCDSRQ